MGITLTSKAINSTYDSLLKLSDNDQLTGAFKVITDGLGNDTGISINNTNQVNIAGQLVVNSSITANSFVRSGGLSTQFLKADGSVDVNTYQNINQKGLANGYAPLDSGAKISETYLPDSVLGQVEYQGLWNGSTNTPTLSTSVTPKGHYYIVSVGGTFDGIAYAIGDWIISDGTQWAKVDNTDAVTTVFGRIGAIVANESDYNTFYHPLNGDLAANADTATTLKTARLINNTSFNGSGNITTAIWGTTRTITIGDTGKSVSGGSNVAWSRAELGITKVNIDALNINAATLGTYNSGQFLRSDVADSATNLTVNTLTIGTSNYIKFGNNDYIRYDDANGAGRFHFDSDSGTNNASLQAALFVGDLQGNASSASLLGNLNNTQFLRSDESDTMSGTLTVDNDVVIKRGTTSGKQSYHSLYIGGDGLNGANSAIYIGNEGDGSGYGYELFYEGTGAGNNNKFKLISENLGTPKVAFEVTQDGDVTFPNNVVVTGSINIDAADLNIGAANLIFSTQSTQAVRGLIWEVNGGFLSKLDGGGTNGGLVELFTNLDDAITTGDVFRIKEGSSANTVFSINGNGNVEVNGTITAGVAGNSSANIPALVVNSSGTGNEQAAIAIQQGTGEGDTIIFADYEPFVEWGISTENSANLIQFTGGATTNNLGSKTLYNNAGNPRTAYIKLQHNLTNGETIIGGNVGIGTSSPASGVSTSSKTLHIAHTNVASVSLDNTTQNAKFELASIDVLGGALSVRKNTSAGTSGATELMRIDSSGNVGINTTSPQAPLHIKQQSVGVASVYSSTIIEGADAQLDIISSSAGTWGSSLNLVEGIGSSNNNIWSIARTTSGGGNNLRFNFGTNNQHDNPTKFIIDSAGNVGIGTTSPSQKLEVNDSSTPKIRFGRGTSYYWDIGHTSSDFQIQSQTGGTIMHLEYTGNVGIGTSSPIAKLSVRTSNVIAEDVAHFGNNNIADGLAITTNGNLDWGFNARNTRNLTFATNQTERMRIASNGNVGIGTTSPDYKLDVEGSGYYSSQLTIDGFSNNQGLSFRKGFSPTNVGIRAKAITTANRDGLEILGYNGIDFAINNGNTVAMHINGQGNTGNEGNVGIGTTSPAAKLTLGGNAVGSTEGLRINDPSNAAYGAHFSFSDTPNEVWIGGVTNNTYNSAIGIHRETTRAITIDVNGNVGIGTTSPSEKLDVNGIIRASSLSIDGGSNRYIYINSSDGLGECELRLGDAADSDAGSIAYNNADDSMQFRANAAERLRIDSSGNVGIGTTSPNAKLHAYQSGTSGSQTIVGVLGSNSLRPVLQFSESTNGSITSGMSIEYNGVGSGDTNYMVINSVSNVPRFTVMSGGNVGIGTTSPRGILDLGFTGDGALSNTTSNYQIVLEAPSGTGDYGRNIAWSESTGVNVVTAAINAIDDGTSSATGLSFSTGNNSSLSERMRITSSGNVGINESNPITKLDVNSGVARTVNTKTYTQFLHTDDADDFQVGFATAIKGGTTSADRYVSLEAANYQKSTSIYSGGLALALNPLGGNVGIGTTAPQAELHIYGEHPYIYITNTAENDAGIVFNDAQAPTGQAASIQFNCGNETLGFFVNDASTERVRIQTNGDTHFSGDVVAYSTSISDERLKDNIETIPNALDKVNLLRGVSYVWNEGSRKGQKDLGLIAQEVEKVLPEIVREKEMSLIDDSGIAYKTIDYEKMVGVLIEAVKELSAEVEQLKAKL